MFNEPGENPAAEAHESIDALVDQLREAPVALQADSPVDPLGDAPVDALVDALRRDLLAADYSEERLLSLVSESARRTTQ